MRTISEDEIFDLLDGSCSAAEAERLHAAIAGNPANRALYEELQALHTGLQQLEVETPPPALTSQLVGQLEGQVASQHRARRHWLRQRPIQVMLLCVATLVVLLVLALQQDAAALAQLVNKLGVEGQLLRKWTFTPSVSYTVLGLLVLFGADRLLLRRLRTMG